MSAAPVLPPTPLQRLQQYRPAPLSVAEYVRQRQQNTLAVGRTAATTAAAHAGLLRLYDQPALARALQLQRICKAHTGCVNTLEWNAAATAIVSGSDDQRVVQTSLLTGQTLAQQKTSHTHNIFAASLLPHNQDMAVTAAADAEVHLVSFLSRQQERVLHTFESFATVAAFVPSDSNTLVAAEMNGPAYLIDLREPAAHELLGSRTRQSSTALDFDPWRPWIFAYTSGRGVALYDIRQLSPSVRIGGRAPSPLAQYLPQPVMDARHDEGPSCIVYSRLRRSEILVNFRSEELYTIDVSDWQPTSRSHDPRYLQRFEGRRNERTFAKQASYLFEERLVVTGCDTGRIAVWNRASGHLIRRFKADHHIVNCTLAHPVKPVLVSSGIDSDIKIWSPASNKKALEAFMKEVEPADTRPEASAASTTSAAAPAPAAAAAAPADAAAAAGGAQKTPAERPPAPRPPQRRRLFGGFPRRDEPDGEEVFGRDAPLQDGASDEEDEDEDEDEPMLLPPRLLLALLAAYRRQLEEEGAVERRPGQGPGEAGEEQQEEEDDEEELEKQQEEEQEEMVEEGGAEGRGEAEGEQQDVSMSEEEAEEPTEEA